MPKKDTTLELMNARDTGDVAALVAYLDDEKYGPVVAKTLGKIGASEAVAPLIEALSAPQDATRSQAAGALQRMRALEAVPALLERVHLEDKLAPRTWAITALGARGDRRAVPVLCDLLTDDEILVRQSAAAALGSLGDPRAIEALQTTGKRERWYDRGQHRRALRRIAKASE